MKRLIEKELEHWVTSKFRKVLLVRGARQVGKTYSVRQLASRFTHFLEVNFEQDRAVKQFFSESLEPTEICRKISTFYSVPIVPGETLLFFDEIQACPDALSALRFFYERLPDLHVIASGSLLELALGEIPSFGVGRISSLFMYSMTFDEFVAALGAEGLLAERDRCSPILPMDNAFHYKLLDLLKWYCVVGGMPKAVAAYAQTRDLVAAQRETADLLETYRDDFAKYRERAPVQRLREVFDSAVMQAGAKFKFSNIVSESSYAPLKDSLELLVQAGLVYKVYHTAARGLPLGAQVDARRFKVMACDVGLHQKIAGVHAADIIAAGDVTAVNSGHVAEVFVGLELLKSAPREERSAVYYWHREQRSSNAEVDYVAAVKGEIVPIEVKAGTRGSMQSMALFMEEHGSKRGVRISLENFARYGKIDVYPAYAACRIMQACV